MAKTEKEPVFEKKAIARSAKYKDKVDLVNALLEDGEEYSLKQTDKIIADYLSKEVK